jgi:hypothetical protein
LIQRYSGAIVSGKGEPPSDLAAKVRDILAHHGWRVAENKEHMACAPARLKVHGLLVHGTAPRLTKGYRNRIRAYEHLLKAGQVSDGDLPRVKGHLAYARSVELFAQGK